MSKVGIVTITGGDNYGNKLQHYAVIQILQAHGYECDTVQDVTARGFATAAYSVDLRHKLSPRHIRSAVNSRLKYRYFRKNSDENLLKNIRRANKNRNHYLELQKRRKRIFQEFADRYLPFGELTVCATRRADKEVVDSYDAFVCGSDQVWNPHYFNTSPVRFLQFAPKHKRVALSPSFGVNSIPNERVEAYTRYLEGMEHLSVREQQGARIIADLTGREVPVIVDPTVMLDAQQWEKIERKPEGFGDEPFLLTYFLGGKSKEYSEQIKKIASQRGLRIINLLDITEEESYLYGPQEFIYLMHNASFVCTDSFHGTVFSILFKRELWAFSRLESGFSGDNRVLTLLQKLEIMDCLYSKGKAWCRVDYERCEELITRERNAFDAYLKTALEKATKPQPQKEYLHIGEWNSDNPTHCSGCSACANACPKGCISMERNKEGFLYPRVEQSSCIHCKQCLRICFTAEKLYKNAETKAYAMQNKDEKILKDSSSGGVFFALARRVIDDGGTVFGVRLDANNRAVHCQANTVEELYPLLGSKYVQSDTVNTFNQAKTLLNSGRLVLFSGTPCQIAGLKSYLSRDYDKLITVDILCHGTPSDKSWQAYLKGKKPIVSASFRNKDKGWRRYSMKLEYDRGSYRKDRETDNYLTAFLKNLNLGESCYDCRFKTIGRCSDLTLADLWGADRIIKGYDDDKGTSLVLTQSSKGEKMLERIKAGFSCEGISLQTALKYNGAAINSVLKPNLRNEFYARLDTEPFDKVCPKTKGSRLKGIKEWLYRLKTRRRV